MLAMSVLIEIATLVSICIDARMFLYFPIFLRNQRQIDRKK